MFARDIRCVTRLQGDALQIALRESLSGPSTRLAVHVGRSPLNSIPLRCKSTLLSWSAPSRCARIVRLELGLRNPAAPRLHVIRTLAATGGGSEPGEGSTTSSAAPRFASYEEFCAALGALTGDPLEADGGRIVISRGNPAAKLMVIGEGPGAEEDRQGAPFVGPSGELLDKILASVNFDRERDVYVSNLVRRRPKDNRDPTDAEMEFYRPWLDEEIRLVDPHIIVLAGRHAMRTLLGEKQGISKVRGSWYEQDGRMWMPVFHPSYLLRNPQWKEGAPKALMWEDINKVRAKYDELVTQSAPF